MLVASISREGRNINKYGDKGPLLHWRDLWARAVQYHPSAIINMYDLLNIMTVRLEAGPCG